MAAVRTPNEQTKGRVNEPIKVLDLFAGCGGLTEGFHQFRPEGASSPVFQSVGAVEWDVAAAASYAMNFGRSSSRSNLFGPPEIFRRDIVGWEPKWEPGEVDVVVGGPPCQGFSGLNRERVGAERNTLWQEFIRVVVALQPKVFVIENVDRFVRSPEFADLRQRIGNGDLNNYELRDAPGVKPEDSAEKRARHYLLNSADYGAMQARRRAIVIGVRMDVDLPVDRMQYPQPTHSREAHDHRKALEDVELSVDTKRPWVTVGNLFAETAHLNLRGTELPDVSGVVPEVDADLPGPFKTPQLHFTRSPEQISLARYDAIPPAGNRMNLRGRYLCRFDDGQVEIIERLGGYRDAEGNLVLTGAYVKVLDGKRARKRFTIERSRPAPPDASRRSGRRRAEIFRVVVRESDRLRDALVEYLSTKAWDAHNAGAGDVMGRMKSDEPSVTIRTEFFKPEKGRYLHPSEQRPITHYEAARIQGFPEDFTWCGSKTEIAKQIGNAVPIPLGRAIAGAIYTYLRPAIG